MDNLTPLYPGSMFRYGTSGTIQFPQFEFITDNTKDGDMTKTPRNFYQFLIVGKDDAIDMQMMIAETEQEARDTIVQEHLGEGVKAKEVEIKLLRTEALKPRVSKDG